MWTEIDEYWVVTLIRPHPLAGKRHGCLNANVCSPEFDDCVLKSRSANEVVLQETRSATLLLPSHESTASLLPPVFNTQLSNSGLHTFALRCPCLLPTSERGRIGVNYSIFIYFCSHWSYVYSSSTETSQRHSGNNYLYQSSKEHIPCGQALSIIHFHSTVHATILHCWYFALHTLFSLSSLMELYILCMMMVGCGTRE